jgi:hypothetical protein
MQVVPLVEVPAQVRGQQAGEKQEDGVHHLQSPFQLYQLLCEL